MRDRHGAAQRRVRSAPIAHAVWGAFASVACAAALAGCYAGTARSTTQAALARDPNWVWVRDVEWVKQTSTVDCGAAALATQLRAWRDPVREADILRAYPPAPQQGIRAGDLRQFARARGYTAFLIAGRFEDLIREVGEGRPVLVGLVQPTTNERGIAHYEVVFGINLPARRVATMDPARGVREDTFAGFAREWAAAGQVALVVSRPGGSPAALNAMK